MKKIYLYITFFLFLFILCFSFSSSYAQNSLSAGVHERLNNNKTELKIHESNYQIFHFTSELAKIEHNDINTANGNFSELKVENYGTSNIIGLPKLPVLRKLIEIPLDAEVQIEIVNYETKEYNLSDLGITRPLMPVQPSISKSDKKRDTTLHINREVYNRNAYIKVLSDNATASTDLVTIEHLGILRGVNLARLNIAPIQYNPVTNTIKVFHNLQVKIKFSKGNVSKTLSLKQKTNSPYFSNTYSGILNYQPIVLSNGVPDTITNRPVKYVIVSDPMFKDILQPFINWKIKKGFQVITAYTDDPAVGQTTSSIKAYLQSMYDNATPGNPAPTFILLVGDVKQIPSFVGKSADGSHYTDLYYAEYTGDFFPEAYYGRFSANNLSQLQPQIDKTLEYEQYQMPDPSFLNNTLLIAGNDDYFGSLMNTQLNYASANYFNSSHGFDSLVYPYPTSAYKGAEIIQKFSQGVGIVNYTGHGAQQGFLDPAFDTTNIPSLTNNHKYPLMIGNACNTNIIIGSSAGFGEAMLRASNKGAVGYIGATDATYWDEDYWWSVGFKSETNPVYNSSLLGAYDGLFHDHGEPFHDWFMTQDQIISAGNLAVTQAGSPDYDEYWEIYQLAGDPSLMIYLGVPPKLNITYEPLLPVGATTFTVTTEPYTYVAISRNDTLYGAALADSTGRVIIPITPFTTAGYASLVATRQNRQPFILDSLNIESPQSPYVIYYDDHINDSLGNNNGLADYNENIFLDITLKNYGQQPDSSVFGILRTSDPFVTVTDSTAKWGIIPSLNASLQKNIFSFKVKEQIPDQHDVIFDLFTGDNNTIKWHSTFDVVLNAPVFSIGTFLIDDSVGGNNNQRLDPGETANIKIDNSNTGHADAINTITSVSSNDPNITINNFTDTLNTLAVNANQYAVFNVTINSSVKPGTNIQLNYQISSGSYVVSKSFILPVGLLIEDFENIDSSKISWDSTSSHPWIIADSMPYHGSNCAESGKITANESSILSTKFKVLYDDSISFYLRISSEPYFDVLQFWIDNQVMGTWSGDSMIWRRVSFPVTAGDHIFKWIYSKEDTISLGADRAWVVYIVFPPVSNYVVSVNNISINKDELLFNIYPNPFRDFVNISLTLKQNSEISIKLYNATGQFIKTIIEYSDLPEGINTLTLDASGLESGFYFCVLNTKNNIVTKKLMIVK